MDNSVINLAILKLIWNTDLKATNFLRSLWKQQNNLTNDDPSINQDTQILKEFQIKILKIPKPPIFKSPLAKTIDPDVDASTWALGSQ